VSPVARSQGHAGRALLVAAVGVAVALGIAAGVAALANRGSVDVKLGSETFADQDADDAAETVAEDGPILYADTAGGDRDIYVQHLGDDPEQGWIAFAARPPGVSRACTIQWDADDELFRLLDSSGEESDECDTPDHHAATAVCWFNTAPIFCQPSILRNLICPLATRLKSRTSAASSVGSELCVFTRRRNSSWSRSIVFVVRSVFHCVLGKRKNVRSSSPPSRRLVTTPGQRLFHVRSKAA